MNNPYPSPQQRSPQYNQQYPPQPYQQYQGPPVQQSRPSHHQGNIATQNQHTTNIPNQSIDVNQQNQLFQQYANSTNPQYGKQPVQSPQGYGQNQPIYFPPPQSGQPLTGLMPPPQLRQQRDHDDTIDPTKTSNMMHQSNSNNNENQVRDILWGEQQQANAFWEQKFFLIYQKFQWFGSRFEMLKAEYMNLSEQLLTVDSEQDWNDLKHHHEEFAEKLEEMFQQLIAVADQNQQLINQRLEQDDGVWQRRYHQLLSNFKALQQKTSILETENQDIKASQQGQQAQQQQNYPQLLSHYRNLQQEYEKLYNAYNKLQQQNDILKNNPQSKGPSLQDFENMRMQYQRTLQSINNENDNLKNECQGFYEQNQNLRHQLHQQAQAYGETEHLSKAFQQKEALVMQLNSELSEWRSKYQSLQSQFHQMVQKETHRAQQIVQQLQRQMQILSQQSKNKQSQYSIISKKLQDELRTREQLIHDHHEQVSKAVKLQNDKHSRQRIILQKQIKALHEQYESLLKQSSEKDLTKYQIQSQQKRVSFLKDQNQQLIQQIKNKNQQLATLRNLSLQVSTYQNVLQQYKILQKQKLIIEENSRKQHNQLLQLKKKNNQLEHQFTQYKSLTSSSGLKSSTSSQLKQLQNDLSQQIQQKSKLQSQIHKYKQLIESKQRYINDLQEQNSRSLSKIQYQQRLIQGTKSDNHNQILTLQRKIQTLQKRSRINEIQFRKQIIDNYEKQIKQLRISNQQKLKRIKRLQQNIHDITTRSTHLQKFSNSHHNQLNLLHNKLSSLENTNSEVIQKLSLSRSTIQSLQQQLQTLKQKQSSLRGQLNSYTVQIQEADNLIKSKNNIILQYQSQIQQFLQKVTNLQNKIDGQKKQKLQRIKKYQQQIQKLKQKLYSNNYNTNQNDQNKRQSFGSRRYSSSYNNRYLTFGTKQPIINQRNQQITKMENNIIQQINQENSKLRSQILELNKKINSLESLSRVVAEERSPTKSPSKSKISNIPAEKDVGLINVNVQQRLLKFNQRLQNCIQDNQLITVRDVDLTASQRIANHQKDKRQMQINYERQIRTLKEQINSLTQQVSKLSSSASAQAQPTNQDQLMDSDLRQFDKYDIINEQAQKTTQQQLQFLRSKLNDQQKTNSALIRLNEHLKKQLQQSFQKSLHSTTQYYKLQWKQAEKSFEQQKQKNKKLNDQNKKLKHQNLQHDTKLMKQYQLKLFNTELKLKQIERQNTYFKIIKTKTENQKANLLHDINVYSADIQTIKSTTQAKVHQYQKITNQLRQKCNTLQRQLYEVNGNQRFGTQNVNSRLVQSNDKLKFSSSRKVLA